MARLELPPVPDGDLQEAGREVVAESHRPAPRIRRQPRPPGLIVRGWRRLRARVLRPVRWLLLRVLMVMAALVLLFDILNPPTTWTIMTRDSGRAARDWTPMRDIAPVVARSVVAAEDANFCRHWGFDMTEIRRVIASGSSRGASTLTQQTAKNVYLWQGRSWLRKALEAVYTPMIEAMWSKRRILEVYLNVAEFGPGVFGIAAGAQYHFQTTPDRLTAAQAAALASVLPDPNGRRARPGAARARQIADGAATIAADGRARCFERP